jgi:hypothetical protein
MNKITIKLWNGEKYPPTNQIAYDRGKLTIHRVNATKTTKKHWVITDKSTGMCLWRMPTKGEAEMFALVFQNRNPDFYFGEFGKPNSTVLKYREEVEKVVGIVKANSFMKGLAI